MVDEEYPVTNSWWMVPFRRRPPRPLPPPPPSLPFQPPLHQPFSDPANQRIGMSIARLSRVFTETTNSSSVMWRGSWSVTITLLHRTASISLNYLPFLPCFLPFPLALVFVILLTYWLALLVPLQQYAVSSFHHQKRKKRTVRHCYWCCFFLLFPFPSPLLDESAWL